jgi:hypothetical protein
MGKNLEGKDSDLTVELIWNVPGGFEEKNNKPQDSPFLA